MDIGGSHYSFVSLNETDVDESSKISNLQIDYICILLAWFLFSGRIDFLNPLAILNVSILIYLTLSAILENMKILWAKEVYVKLVQITLSFGYLVSIFRLVLSKHVS
ncbi:hypothetical protein ACOSQ3_004364 [Xanthoceras sorbifolium]